MFKTKLQELCQQKLWHLPSYSLSRDGPDHQPRFKATVLVNGVPFDCTEPGRSSKEAQNEAAKIAFEHFTSPKSPISSPTVSSSSPLSGSSSSRTILRNSPNGQGTLLGKSEETSKVSPTHGNTLSILRNSPNGPGTVLGKNGETSKVSPSHGNTLGVEDNQESGDAQYLCKSQLQIYAQKRNLSLPVYSSIRQGMPHAPRFKAIVIVDGQTFESSEFCRTLREAEHAAAKIALSSLSEAGNQEVDCGLYKNLLLDLTRKEGIPVPIYKTNTSGASHVPNFTSTVEAEGVIFHGVAAKTKKQAEMNAAKVAYISLKERQLSRMSSVLSDAQAALESIKSTPYSTISADFQKKLNIGSIADLTPIIRAEENKDCHPKADLAKISTEDVEANGDHPMTSPLKAGTGFERHQVSSPLAPSPNNGSSSPTTVLEYSDCLAIKLIKGLPAEASGSLCNKVVVYPRKSDLKFQEIMTVLPISDDQWVAATLDHPNQ